MKWNETGGKVLNTGGNVGAKRHGKPRRSNQKAILPLLSANYYQLVQSLLMARKRCLIAKMSQETALLLQNILMACVTEEFLNP